MANWVELVDATSSQTLTNKTLTTAVLGSSTATTQSQGDNSTKVATTAYVDTAAAAGDTTLADGKIWVGNGSGEKAEKAPSGDLSMSNAGAFTVTGSAGDFTVGTSLRTATIDYTDGDLAMTIADGGGVTTSGDLAVTGDLTVTGNDIKSSGGTTAITMSGADVSIAGDLTVTGKNITTTAEVLKINDNTIVLNADLSATTDVDSGIVVERGGSGDNAIFYWDEGKDRWRVGTNDDADLSTSPTYAADLMQIRIDGAAINTSSTEVPIGHFQYHDGSLYLRVED